MPTLSPLAPTSYPTLPLIDGVRISALPCGIRYSGRKDLMLMEFIEGTTVAGVFTTSKTASAPVLRSKQHLAGGTARALLVNSGNSNAFTGQAGEMAVSTTLGRVAQLVGCEPEECFVASTGVIGEPLPYEKIMDALPQAYQSLESDSWRGAAEAIMTTDTFPKLTTRTATIGDTRVTINGIAKGSGMIAPDMATMLAFIATDAAIPSETLQQMLSELNEQSFNSITVDSDTSTSDTVLVFATGTAKNNLNDSLDDFKIALQSLLLELAHQIVRDGEGATKFVTVRVDGAESDQAAKRIGMTIANSPLIKTAIAGQDPNWGRVVMAVGKSGEKADRDALKIWFGGTLVAQNGQVHPEYQELVVANYMKREEIEIRVDIGVGHGHATVWTCDFTEQYIRINADYRS